MKEREVGDTQWFHMRIVIASAMTRKDWSKVFWGRVEKRVSWGWGWGFPSRSSSSSPSSAPPLFSQLHRGTDQVGAVSKRRSAGRPKLLNFLPISLKWLKLGQGLHLGKFEHTLKIRMASDWKKVLKGQAVQLLLISICTFYTPLFLPQNCNACNRYLPLNIKLKCFFGMISMGGIYQSRKMWHF